MAKNQNLQDARRGQNDEFYTQLPDIENELVHYRQHFKGKVVYCNCDDPSVSNFFHYFSYKFHDLGLKKLITTCYKNKQRDIFSKHNVEKAIRLEYNGFRDGDRIPRPEDIGITSLEKDGDFRSKECIHLLKEADIVVTNPPFSLFHEYIAQLIQFDKKFIIIGPWSAVTDNNFFKLVKENKLWLGYGFNAGNAYFAIPSQGKRFASGVYDPKTGLVKFRNVTWFTNLDHNKRHKKLLVFRKYTSDDYPTYDNYNAIEVSKVNDIPEDYEGVMGVPITFLNKYNPNQFEIIGSDTEVKLGEMQGILNPEWGGKTDRGYVKGCRKFARIFIRNRNPKS